MSMRTSAADTDMQEAINILNHQPDILTAIVKQRTQEKGHYGDLYIQIVDPDGKFVQIALRPPPTREEKIIKLEFNPPLGTMMDARPRLWHWRSQARAKFNIPTHPVVSYFKRPPLFPFFLPAVIAIAALFYANLGTDAGSDWLRAQSSKWGGPAFLKFATYFCAALHLVIEPAYMLFLTYKHSTPLVPRIKWVLWNVAIGYGALDEFWECIMYENVRHVYKQTDVGDIGPYLKGSEVDDKKKKQ